MTARIYQFRRATLPYHEALRMGLSRSQAHELEKVKREAAQRARKPKPAFTDDKVPA